jgi:iron complex transport system substrate-binding protein
MRYSKGVSIQRDNDTTCSIYLSQPGENQHLRSEVIHWKYRQIQRVGCLSTTHIPFIMALKCDQTLVATGFSECRHYPGIDSSIQSDKIKDLSVCGNLDKELLIKTSPELFFTYPFGGNTCQDMLNAGIGCVQVTEYLEEHPLGRAEWIKLFGALLNRSTLADSIFENIENRYNEATAIAHQDAPIVFFGTFDGEAYYAPPSNSFIAQLIRDAGAKYYFEGRTGSFNIRLDKEEMMEITTKADFMGSVEFGKNEWANNIQSISSGKKPVLFRCDAAQKDYYGKALLEPDALLIDFNLIFHSGSFPTDSLKYFELCK